MREVVSVVASGNLKGNLVLNDTQKILLFHLNPWLYRKNSNKCAKCKEITQRKGENRKRWRTRGCLLYNEHYYNVRMNFWR